MFEWSDSLQWYPGLEGKAIMCPTCGIDVSNGLKNHPGFRKKLRALKEKKKTNTTTTTTYTVTSDNEQNLLLALDYLMALFGSVSVQQHSKE